MALISYSVFREKVETGIKPHTIRFRANPPSVGEYLFLWWKSRTPERAFTGVTICTRVDEIILNGHLKTVFINGKKLAEKEIIDLAITDGFTTVEDFWVFFSESTDDDKGCLIWWEPDYITKRRILPEVQINGNFETDIIKSPVKHYYPSNGTEGMIFDEHWCDHCSRQKDCVVYLNALNDGRSSHWLIHEDRPTCTVFTPVKKAKRSQKAESKEQLKLSI